MNALHVIKRGTRNALRRRYGYAALRVMRRTLRRAVALQLEQQHQAGAKPPTRAAIIAAARDAYRRLRARWPDQYFDDPRALP